MTSLPLSLVIAACFHPGAGTSGLPSPLSLPWMDPKPARSPRTSDPSGATPTPKMKSLVYGTVSGAALTMDIYEPKKSNKIGIIVIPGTAYGYAYLSEYNQSSITENFAHDDEYFGKYAKLLVDKGYTLFVINHRLSPRFNYIDIIGDCQRAVRYIRFHASTFGIDPQRLGALGFSSGGTLCAMLGVTDREGAPSNSGLDAVSSKVQSVVALAGRFDLADFNKPEDARLQNPIISRVLLNYLGELPPVDQDSYVMRGKYAEASPLHHVDKDDASFLLYCSQDDPLVPPRQALRMRDRLLKVGIKVKLRQSDHEGHTPIPDINEIDEWFLNTLKK